MIQINLIPDIKRELLQAQRVRRFAITISIFAGIVAGGIVVVLGLVLGSMQLIGGDLDKKIDQKYSELSSINNVTNILTIQNQLNNIQGQYDSRIVSSRLFDILSAINPPAPNSVTFSTIKLDPASKLIMLEGSAVNGYPATETLQKTILNTKIEYVAVGSSDPETVALAEAVDITETGYGESADGGRVVRFSISFAYPETLFSNVASMRIVTPSGKQDVTDSKTRVPDDLFAERAKDIEGDN